MIVRAAAVLALLLASSPAAAQESLGSHVGDQRARSSVGTGTGAVGDLDMNGFAITDAGLVTSDYDTYTDTITSCLEGVVCDDDIGIRGGQMSGTTDPTGLFIRPGACWPGDAACAAGSIHLYGGQDTTTITIDGADPSVTCAGDNDTVTICATIGSTGLCEGGGSGVVLTEGTEWTATASVADTCASLAAAIAAHASLTGIDASCTSPDARIVLNPGTGRVTLTESTAGCTTVATGTPGSVKVFTDIILPLGFSVLFGTDDGLTCTANDNCRLTVAGNTFIFSNVAFSVPGVTASFAGSASLATTAVTRTDVIQFCGNGPNGATAVYLEPLVEAALYADATCDGNDSTTETTSDMVWRPFDFSVVSMECGCTDVAVDTGLTFSFRDDTATASTDLECTTGAGDASGFVTCEDMDTTPPTVAAGSAIAMRIVAASGNFSTADCFCRLTVSQ